MFYNVFSAEMALSITDQNIAACQERRAADEDGIICDADYDRNVLLYLLLASCCIDYIREAGLKEADDLHKSIVGNLANLADFLTWGNFKIDYAKYSECIAKGAIPIDDNVVSFAGECVLYEMSKQVFDGIMEATSNIIRDVFGSLMIREPVDYDSLGDWVKNAFNKAKGKRGNPFNSATIRQKDSDQGLDFDL